MALINIGKYHINPAKINYIERIPEGLHIVFDGEYTVYINEKDNHGQMTTEYVMTQVFITNETDQVNGHESSDDARDDKENGKEDQPA
jgi:hypothetical protein